MLFSLTRCTRLLPKLLTVEDSDSGPDESGLDGREAAPAGMHRRLRRPVEPARRASLTDCEPSRDSSSEALESSSPEPGSRSPLSGKQHPQKSASDSWQRLESERGSPMSPTPKAQRSNMSGGSAPKTPRRSPLGPGAGLGPQSPGEVLGEGMNAIGAVVGAGFGAVGGFLVGSVNFFKAREAELLAALREQACPDSDPLF